MSENKEAQNEEYISDKLNEVMEENEAINKKEKLTAEEIRGVEEMLKSAPKEEQSETETQETPEKGIVEKMAEANAEISKEPERKPLKKELIDEYKRLMKLNGLESELPSNWAIKRLRLNVLQRKIAKLSETSIKSIIKNKDSEEKNAVIMKEVKKDIEESKELTEEERKEALDIFYSLHVVGAKNIEMIAKTLKPYTKVDMRGFTKTLCVDKEAQLKKALDMLIKKYGTRLTYFMNPIYLYIYILTSSASEVITANSEKNSLDGSKNTYGLRGDAPSVVSPLESARA